MNRNILLLILFMFLTGAVYTQEKQAVKIDSAGIKACSLDYGEGWYTGDPARMQNAVHTDLNKIVVNKLPSGKAYINYSTPTALVEYCRAKVGLLAPEKRKLSVTILKASENTALVRLNSAMFNDYLVLVKIEDHWKIVNVLWVYGPDSQGKQTVEGFDNTKDIELSVTAAKNFTEGLAGNEIEKLENVLHAEFNMISFQKQATGKYSTARTRYSGIIEPVRAKMRQAQQLANLQVNFLDGMNGIAFIETIAGSTTRYLQLAKIENQWKVLNVLTKPAQ